MLYNFRILKNLASFSPEINTHHTFPNVWKQTIFSNEMMTYHNLKKEIPDFTRNVPSESIIISEKREFLILLEIRYIDKLIIVFRI